MEELSTIAQHDSRVTLPNPILDQSDSVDPCLTSRPSEGACQPYFDRWTFDQGAKVCRKYKTATEVDAGVQNSFASQTDCQSICGIHMPDRPRNCTASISPSSVDLPKRNDRCMPRKRYRFNAEEGRCQDFSRFGCKVNADSYATIEECEANCLSVPDEIPDQSSNPFPGKNPICDLPSQVKRLVLPSNSEFLIHHFHPSPLSKSFNGLALSEAEQRTSPKLA